uniref:Ionotropic receptor 75a N-terminal domain-containing protein n=1 Tax=Glossina morsitans morsitans TaxID=37546 RepID=A0A1B0G4E1_GLOMM
MQAFRDFLLNQHLKHAIIIRQRQQQQQQPQGQRDYLIEIRDLAVHCHIRFYRVPAKEDIENLFYKSSPKVGIYMNISDPEESLHVLQDFAVKDKFKNSYAWFITMQAPADGLLDNFKIIKNIFDPLRLHINADVTVAIRVNGSHFHLYDVYKILPDFPVTIEIKGNWSLQKGLIIDHKFNYGFMARRTNFQNISINVATVLHDKPKHFANYTFLSNNQDWKELDPMPRQVYGLMRPMEDLYNFSLVGIQIRQEYKRRSEHHEQSQQLEKHVDFAMLVAAEALLMQGPPSEIFHLISSRTLIATVCVFVFILMEFYNGYIVGSLLAESPRTLTTLEALYNSNLELGMEDIQYNYNIFKNSSSQLMHIIYKERILGANGKSHTNILPLEQGINRIAQGGFAFHMSIDRAYRLLEIDVVGFSFDSRY